MEGLLLGLGFIGVAVAILTPYLKSGAGLALISTAAYFHFIGTETWLPIVLFTAGLLLIVFEIFVPEFGAAGIIGIVLLISGLYLTIGDFGQTIRDLSLSVVITTGVIIYLIKNGYSLSNVNKLILQTNMQSSNNNKTVEKDIIQVDDEGVAVTPLRPSGKVTFGDDPTLYDVLSTEGHISKGTAVIVDKVKGTKITVRKK
ncbi:membrane-bound serine protease (ClpP class) [Alkalibacterium subtropicum]|uniref:Membrane-bound serine protease (ClpP class) n=1 Tax=Alkalibacterium subtropicum TaxID=753702 RepID=A0A1I1HWZ2_9LACT|nr:NfeD family protein [Alkalibacterium subtropicum]SFC26488.1 membrane-bound serine protease (ClpP class) [Alkalibacterium subtropicum]